MKSESLIIEGDNALVMDDLLKSFSGKIDCMIWDPPYNTGRKDFMYNDNFYPTKEELKQKYQSRHSKWLSFMEVRLELAKKLLKDTGVIAVHISYHELFRLGLLMDEIFGEENRLGIINWECAYSPKNNNKGIPSTTDYILVYAKNKNLSFRGIIPRTELMDARYNNIDGDNRAWASDNLTVARNAPANRYGIENPLTGELHFPPSGRSWVLPKSRILEILCNWDVQYIINSQGNCVLKNSTDRNKAKAKLKKGPWPRIFFLGKNGEGRPRLKRYRDELKNEGRVLGTYWESNEVLDIDENQNPINLSLSHEISGHNDSAKKLLKAILGDKCTFDTPKPLKLTERLIEMFCPKDGIVLDAFGGSATTAHAVLSLNEKDKESKRRFILIENGEFIEAITVERVRRVITGKWAHPTKETKPLNGSFIYLERGKE